MIIKFKRMLSFLGRNGYSNMAGIEISGLTCDDKAVWLEPITSKDKTGRCRLEIPLEEVARVIAAMRKEAELLRGHKDIPDPLEGCRAAYVSLLGDEDFQRHKPLLEVLKKILTANGINI